MFEFQYRTYLGCFILSLLGTVLLTPTVARLALRLGFVDRPVNRKTHRGAVPLLGGLAIFAGVWLPLGLLLIWYNRVAEEVQAQEGKLLLIFLGGLAMLLLGMIDDKRGLNAKWKFAVQIPVAMALVSAGVSFEGISIPYFSYPSFGAAAPVLSVIWLVGITNALNLIDGIDGLAGGVTLLVAAAIAILAIGTNQVLLAVVMCSMAGACLGFLRYNFSPAKIFLGDSGSLFLGMTLAISAVLGSVKAQIGASLLVPVVLLGYPIADTLLAMARRYFKGKSMFRGDASHIHHRLVQKGLDERQSCYLIYACCLGLCVWTLAIQREQLGGILLGSALFLTLALVVVHKLDYFPGFNLSASRAERHHFKAAHHYAQMMKAKLGTADLPEDVLRLLSDVSQEFGQTGSEIALADRPLWRGSNVRWGEGRVTGPAANHKAANLLQDQYQFDETGLSVFAFYEEDDTTEDFRMEKRTLFEELCVASDQRLLEMAKAMARPDLTRDSRPAGRNTLNELDFSP